MQKFYILLFNSYKEAKGELPVSHILEEIPKRVQLDSWDTEIYQKTGYIRWQSILHFFTIDCVKSGFLFKKKGIWFLTKEGEAAMALGERALLEAASKGYDEWKRKKDRVSEEGNSSDIQELNTNNKYSIMTLEQMELLAIESLKHHVNAMTPYEFQDLVAALLRGMGYYTPLIAQRGKDGGIDITAYRDPLGTMIPRIKVQVKHRAEQPSSVDTVRQLMGLLQKNDDVGMFVSTGGFTNDAKAAARSSHIHVELVDLDRFINLWQEFYLRLTDNDKALMPLRAVYFLAPEE